MSESEKKSTDKLLEEIEERNAEKNAIRDDSDDPILSSYDPSFEKRFKGFKVSTVKRIYRGENGAVKSWSDNEWCDRIPVRQEYHTDEFALQTFLIWEKMEIPDILRGKEAKEFEKMMRFAAHPDLPGYYSFPYLFIKLNPKFSNFMTPKGEQFRIVVPVRTLMGDLDLNAPLVVKGDRDSGTIVDWENRIFKLQVSKKLYELRDEVVVQSNFIERFVQFETTGREIFSELKSVFQKQTGYVDVDEHWATFLALWVMGTHVFYLFNAFPYVLVYSVGGQGKTRLLKTLCYSSRNGRLVENPTAASMFRSIDVIRSTLCVDEADKIRDDTQLELLGLWNSGYEAGHSIPRWVMDENRLASFATYSPKAFATNKKLDPTLASRCIRVTVLATNDEEVQYRIPFADDPYFRGVREDLTIWAIDSTPELMGRDRNAIIRKYKAQFENELIASGEISTNIPPRLIQIMTPILAIYDFLGLDEDLGSTFPSERDNLRKVMSAIINDKRSSMVPWLDQEVILGLYEVASANQLYTIHSKDVADHINQKEDSGESDDPVTSSKVGLVLDKYFPEEKRQVHGKTEWLPYCKDSVERLEKVSKVMDRLNIEYRSKRINRAMDQKKLKKQTKEQIEIFGGKIE